MKKLLLSILICVATAAPLQAQLFGHSSRKVNNLKSALEQIKKDYDNALTRVSILEQDLQLALATCNSAQDRINMLAGELNVSRAECEQLKSMDDKRHEDLAKQVDRLVEATQRLEALEKDIDEMAQLPEQIFGNK